MFWFFWPWGMWDLTSLTRDRTCTPCIGRRSLNQWTAREVPPWGLGILLLPGSICYWDEAASCQVHTIFLLLVPRTGPLWVCWPSCPAPCSTLGAHASVKLSSGPSTKMPHSAMYTALPRCHVGGRSFNLPVYPWGFEAPAFPERVSFLSWDVERHFCEEAEDTVIWSTDL